MADKMKNALRTFKEKEHLIALNTEQAEMIYRLRQSMLRLEISRNEDRYLVRRAPFLVRLRYLFTSKGLL